MLDDNSDYAVTVFHFRSQFLARATRHTFFHPLGNNRRAATCFFFFPFPFCSFILFYFFFFYGSLEIKQPGCSRGIASQWTRGDSFSRRVPRSHDRNRSVPFQLGLEAARLFCDSSVLVYLVKSDLFIGMHCSPLSIPYFPFHIPYAL